MHLTEWRRVRVLGWKERKEQTKYANKRGEVWGGSSRGEKNKEWKVKRKGKKDDRQVEEVRQGLSEGW